LGTGTTLDASALAWWVEVPATYSATSGPPYFLAAAAAPTQRPTCNPGTKSGEEESPESTEKAARKPRFLSILLWLVVRKKRREWI
jgi:hypothetical protein